MTRMSRERMFALADRIVADLTATESVMIKTDDEKAARFEAALNQIIERVAADRNLLALVLVGSLSPAVIWDREAIGLWIIEADGVTRRLRSDGNDERIFRILV